MSQFPPRGRPVATLGKRKRKPPATAAQLRELRALVAAAGMLQLDLRGITAADANELIDRLRRGEPLPDMPGINRNLF